MMKNSIQKLGAFLAFALLLTATFCGVPVRAAQSEAVLLAAVPGADTVSLNGQSFRVQSYRIGGETYFKLRDFAALLNGTTAEFSVEWDSDTGSIRIRTETPYRANGSELALSSTAAEARVTAAPIYVDGNRAELTAYSVDRSTCIQLSQLADLIGFTIEVDAASDSAVIHNAPPENGEDPDGYVLTLLAGRSEAFLNGIAVALSAAPFVENGIFYIPLKDVTKLLGGTYSFDGQTATVTFRGDTTRYTVGSSSLTVNGETDQAKTPYYTFATDSREESAGIGFTPILSGGAVFLPDQFFGSRCPGNSVLNGLREYPESGMVILGGFEQEQGVREVKLLNRYDTLPASFRTRLRSEGVVGEVLNYNIEAYQGDGLDVYVMRRKAGTEDSERMDGRVCAIRADDPTYSTRRGLRVGNSVYRAWLLYGYDNLTYSFYYTESGGKVASMVFYTRYYGEGL